MTERIVSPRVKASKEEVVASYDTYAPLYAKVTLWEKETQEIVVAKAEIREGYRVLDAGCGPGTIVIKAAERVGASGRVYGVDLSEKMLQEAMKRAQNAGVQDRIAIERQTCTRLCPSIAISLMLLSPLTYSTSLTPRISLRFWAIWFEFSGRA